MKRECVPVRGYIYCTISWYQLTAGKNLTPLFFFFFVHFRSVCEGISSSMNFDEEEDDEDEISSSSSQLNSNTRPGSATSKKSCKVRTAQRSFIIMSMICLFFFCLRTSDFHQLITSRKKCRFNFVTQLDTSNSILVLWLKLCWAFAFSGLPFISTDVRQIVISNNLFAQKIDTWGRPPESPGGPL